MALSKEEKKPKVATCPEFPFFGAKYPDAGCIDGQLYDLDKCDDNGNLYVPGEYWPCPFCNTEEFIKHYACNRNMKFGKVRQMVKELKAKYIQNPSTNG